MEGLKEHASALYRDFGQSKPMGSPAPDSRHPHFFLLRTFFGENDLLTIFNTKRCAYQCYFCQLPAKSSINFITAPEIISQFKYVVDETRHALSILDRVTLSNEGSVLDTSTFPTEALLEISGCVNEFRRVRTLVLETRLEYLDPAGAREIQELCPKVTINILTGFETHDPLIRDEILGKRESLEEFEQRLNLVADCHADLTAYVLYKPSYTMSDEEAFDEADRSVDYLLSECKKRDISLSLRLDPMYAAAGSRWAKFAHNNERTYKPPRLTDVMRFAESKAKQGLRIYIGLSTEGLDDGDSYMKREDYSASLIRPVKLFNDLKISSFRSFLSDGSN